MRISCEPSAGAVQWFRLAKYDEDRAKAAEVKAGGRTEIPPPGAKLLILDVRVEDKGVYFCKVNHTWGPGTELQVASKGAAERPSPMSPRISTDQRPLLLLLPSEALSRAKGQYRTQMKDGLIILQALLLAMCTAALMLRKQRLVRNDLVGLSDRQLEEKKKKKHVFLELNCLITDFQISSSSNMNKST